jgi:fermentation-respiration switch protein FrsA (DUF1100 family)
MVQYIRGREFQYGAGIPHRRTHVYGSCPGQAGSYEDLLSLGSLLAQRTTLAILVVTALIVFESPDFSGATEVIVSASE